MAAPAPVLVRQPFWKNSHLPASQTQLAGGLLRDAVPQANHAYTRSGQPHYDRVSGELCEPAALGVKLLSGQSPTTAHLPQRFVQVL